MVGELFLMFTLYDETITSLFQLVHLIHLVGTRRWSYLSFRYSKARRRDRYTNQSTQFGLNLAALKRSHINACDVSLAQLLNWMTAPLKINPTRPVECSGHGKINPICVAIKKLCRRVAYCDASLASESSVYIFSETKLIPSWIFMDTTTKLRLDRL